MGRYHLYRYMEGKEYESIFAKSLLGIIHLYHQEELSHRPSLSNALRSANYDI
jgi:hypothetical protein